MVSLGGKTVFDYKISTSGIAIESGRKVLKKYIFAWCTKQYFEYVIVVFFAFYTFVWHCECTEHNKSKLNSSWLQRAESYEY